MLTALYVVVGLAGMKLIVDFFNMGIGGTVIVCAIMTGAVMLARRA